MELCAIRQVAVVFGEDLVALFFFNQIIKLGKLEVALLCIKRFSRLDKEAASAFATIIL